MAKYPIFLELSGRTVLLIGAGKVALRKAHSLLEAGAVLTVVAKDMDESFITLSKSHNVELINSHYSKNYLTDAVLVIAATSNKKLNTRIYNDCRELGIFCNTVDEPELCDFFTPAVLTRGDLKIAVGTNGKCPAYAACIKKKLERLFTAEHSQFLSELQPVRKKVLKEVAHSAQRKLILDLLVSDESFDYFKYNGPAAWRKRAEKIIHAPPTTQA